MSEEVEPEPEVEDDGRPRWSFSQLNTYANCSEMWRLEKLVKPRIPKKKAPWFVLGQGVHRAIEQWFRDFCQTDIVELFYAAYDEERASDLRDEPDLSAWTNPGRRGLTEVLDDNRIKGATMVQKFVEWFEDPETHWDVMRDPDDGAPWVEVPFDLDLGGIRVIGSIDAVEMGGEPTDWKTGQKKGTRALQLGLYKYALESQYGVDGNVGQFFYLGGAVDSRKSWGLSDHNDLRRYNEAYLTDIFTAAQRGIEAEVFIPNPGELCEVFCDVREFCREMGSRPIPLKWQEIEYPWWAPVVEPADE